MALNSHHPKNPIVHDKPDVSLHVMFRLSRALGHPKQLFGTNPDIALIELAIKRLAPRQIFGPPQCEPPSVVPLTDEERAQAIEQARDNPATAGEIEYAAWIQRLELTRDMRCLNPKSAWHGQFGHHDDEPMDPIATGYYWRCRTCGHQGKYPF